MYNFRMTVQYDGTRYRGWQRLGDSEWTIQGKLETLLSRLCGEDVQVIGSGRTDAGVHALAQIAHFHIGTELRCGELSAGFREFLPEDISVTAVDVVPERFHARYNAKSKIYRYRLDVGSVPDVFFRKYAFHCPDDLSINRMRRAAALLQGKRDFRSFTNSRYKNKSTIRNLQGVELLEDGNFLDMQFIGSGFLHNMVRILAGTLVDIGKGEMDPSSVPAIIEACDRHASGPMLPAHGLTLMRVEY